MRITCEDVVGAFQSLLQGETSREDVATWASQVRAADDADDLEYEPPSAETAIWTALEFLLGVDLKDGPDSYLHSTEDVETYWASKQRDLVQRHR